jgi:hypothetical protein
MSSARQINPPAWGAFKRASELQRAGRISDALDVFYAVMLTCDWHRTDIDWGRRSPRGWIDACEVLIRARTLHAVLALVVETQEERSRLAEKRDMWTQVAEELLDQGGFAYAHGPKSWRGLAKPPRRLTFQDELTAIHQAAGHERRQQ